MSVVLPAPSGPTSPRIRPRGNCAEMPPSATTGPNSLRSPSSFAASNGVVSFTTIAARGSGIRRHHLRARFGHSHGHRHALAKDVLRILRDDSQSIHEVIAHLLGLHALRRELRLRRNEAHRAIELLARHRIDLDLYPHARLDTPEPWLRHVRPNPHG